MISGTVALGGNGVFGLLRRSVILGVLPACTAALGGADQDLLAEINAFRARSGRGPLVLEARLSRAALMHSQDMLATNRMAHRGSDGSDTDQRLARVGYAWLAYRENIAAGLSDPRRVVAMWIDSPPHRANMLTPQVSQMGAGYAWGPGTITGGIPRQFWTAVFASPPLPSAEPIPPPA